MSFEIGFLGPFIAVVTYTSFRYLSRIMVARRFLGALRFVRGGAFLACSSSALYYSEAPIYSIMLRMVTVLERVWLASSMLIYIEAD